MVRNLDFSELTEDEQDQYMALTNKIDGKLLEKFAKGLVVKGVLMVLTGGVYGLITAPLWVARAIGKSNAVDKAKAYVNDLKDRYYCDFINWNSFPAAHVILGRDKLPNNAGKVKCPVCKKIALQVFSADYDKDIMSCSNCGKNITLKYTGSNKIKAEQLIIHGYGAVALADVAGHALDINLEDITSFFESLIDFL